MLLHHVQKCTKMMSSERHACPVAYTCAGMLTTHDVSVPAGMLMCEGMACFDDTVAHSRQARNL